MTGNAGGCGWTVGVNAVLMALVFNAPEILDEDTGHDFLHRSAP